jgi:glycerol-3-phosphate dehydrogenase
VQSIDWDLLVIGSGAIGLGSAIEAASRGLKVVVLDKGDIGNGTSSRSTKLFHGGVRYLKSFQFKFLFKSLREKRILINLSTGLIRPINFHLPVNSFSKAFYYFLGISFYKFFSKDFFLINNFKNSGIKKFLKSSFCLNYTDLQFDESRYLMSLMYTAESFGVIFVTYTSFESFKNLNNNIKVLKINDLLTGNNGIINTKFILNVTGFNVCEVRKQLIKNNYLTDNLTFSSGFHIVLDKLFFPIDSSAIIIPETTDGRVMYIIPWRNSILIGTTDETILKPDYDIMPSKKDINFLLENVTPYLAKTPELNDIKSIFSGVRTLYNQNNFVKKSSESISREHFIDVDESGILSVFGGKWTMYRSISEEVVNTLNNQFNLGLKASFSKFIKLKNCSSKEYYKFSNHIDDYRITDIASTREHYSSQYDLSKDEILTYIIQEHAFTLEDILARRTSILYEDARHALILAPKVISVLAEYYDLDENWKKIELENFAFKVKKFYLIN